MQRRGARGGVAAAAAAGSDRRVAWCMRWSVFARRSMTRTPCLVLGSPPSPLLEVADVGLPGKRNSDSHGARPVHLIITSLRWIRTSRLPIKNSLSVLGSPVPCVGRLLVPFLGLLCRQNRGTSPLRNSVPLGPCSWTMLCLGPFESPRGGGLFLRARYPLYGHARKASTLEIPRHVGIGSLTT